MVVGITCLRLVPKNRSMHIKVIFMCTSGLFSVALLWIAHYISPECSPKDSSGLYSRSPLWSSDPGEQIHGAHCWSWLETQLSAHCREQWYHCRGWVGLNEQQQPYPFKLCHHLWAETEVKALLVGPIGVADMWALVVYSVPASATLTAPVWTWPLLTSRRAVLLPTPAVRFFAHLTDSIQFTSKLQQLANR